MFNSVYQGLSQTIQTEDFTPLFLSIVKSLNQQGVEVDRLQIPMNRISGLRHPKYAVIVLTFADGTLDTVMIPHEYFAGKTIENFEHLRSTPFAPVIDHPNTVKKRSLLGELEFQRLQELQAEGYTEYACGNMVLPHGAQQLFSVASKHPQGFVGDIEQVLGNALQLIGLCLYAAYQSNVAAALAETYLGARTGENVLTGSMYRGSQEKIDAGIMFCDVRGFTAMSEKLGAEGVVKVMNDVFQIIEDEVTAVGGEICKFIGDALLIIFPRGLDTDDAILSTKMIDSALQAVLRVEEHGREQALPLSVGFGCHIGEVLYGNIGTQSRLDFTVMGPAVNLTSRLESMCKSLGAQLTVSSVVAEANIKRLDSFGRHSVKGIAEPVEIWGVPVNG